MPSLTSNGTYEDAVSEATTPVILTAKLHSYAKQLRPVPNGMHWPSDLKTSGCIASYAYSDEQGRLLTVLCHYDWLERQESGRVEELVVPFTAWQQPDGTIVWARKYLAGPRPLYALQDLLTRHDALVILSEGEKSAAAVQKLAPAAVSTTWMGGSTAIKETNFAVLKGRKVCIFPKNDAPGRQVTAALLEVLRKADVASVQVLDIAALSLLIIQAAPEGFDIADLVEAGLTKSRYHAQIESYPKLLTEIDLSVPSGEDDRQIPAPVNAQTSLVPVAEDDGIYAYLIKAFGWHPDLPETFNLSNEGVFKHDIDGRGRPVVIYAGSPIVVLGRTRRGGDGQGWGYLVAFKTPLGRWETAVIPARKLAGDGREVREVLADLGVSCPQDRAGRVAQSESIAYSCRQVTDIIDVSAYPGWMGSDVFALPERILVAPGSDRQAMLDMEQGRQHRFGTSGTFDGWRDTTRLMEHNSRGNLVICMSFAGCLMRPLGAEGGGVHLWGRTSMSKTSLATAAGATWGGDPRDGFVNSWRATDNGVEGLAAVHNDTLLILDELALVDADRLAEIHYMLGNGQGKARATKTGGVQPISNWVSSVLSTGEITTAAHIKSGSAGKRGAQTRVPGGVGVRMVDLPVALASGTKCSFEDLGPFETEAALANHLKAQAKLHYGHAGPAFVEALLADRDAQIAIARVEIDQFVHDVSDPGDDPEVGRVAARFGLIAAAGEMAVRFGILPWREGAADTAARICYAAWKDSRGDGTLSHDERDALSTLKQFFELHGSSRFEPLVSYGGDTSAERLDERIVRDRCGYRRHDEQGTIYYVTPEAWRSEICTNVRDPEFVARVALGCGALIPGEGSRLLKNVRLPDHSNPKRVYAIRPDLLP